MVKEGDTSLASLVIGERMVKEGDTSLASLVIGERIANASWGAVVDSYE